MKKLYLLLIAAIFCLSAGADDYYLIGAFNDWQTKGDNCKFTDQEDGTYVLDYNGTLTSGFKINDGTWDNDDANFGGDGQLTIGQTYYLTKGGGSSNITIAEAIDNPHIVFNPEEMTLLITEASYKYGIHYGNKNSTDWTTEDLEESEGKWSGTFTLADNINFGIKQIDASSGAQTAWISANGTPNITAAGDYPCQVGGADFTIPAGTYDITFDPETMILTVAGGNFNVQYVLCGQFTTSAFGDKELTDNGDGTWTAQFRVRQDQRFDIRALKEDGTVAYWIIPTNSKQYDGLYRTLIEDNGIYYTKSTTTNNADVNAEGIIKQLNDCFVIPSGNYTFTYKPSEYILEISGGQFTNPDYTIYFTNSASWNTPIKAYVWDGNNIPIQETWPGTAMTDNDGYWTLNFKSKWTPANVIFNDGSDYNKTADFRFMNNCYYNEYGVDEGKMGVPTPYTVKYDNSNSEGAPRWGAVYCYVYDEGDNEFLREWPGKEMTRLSNESSIWTCSFEDYFEPKYVIFNDGTKESSVIGKNQTAEFIFVNNMTYQGMEMHTYTVTCKNSIYNQVYCYAFYFDDESNKIEVAGGWPGVLMKKLEASASAMMRAEANADTWTVDLHSNQAPTYVQFNNGIEKDFVKNPDDPDDPGNSKYSAEYRYSPDDNTIFETTGVENVVIEAEPAAVEYYNLQGVRVANPTRGLYIRRCGNTATKVIL